MVRNLPIMLTNSKRKTFIIGACLALVNFISCSKSGTDEPADPCAGVSIAVNGTVVNTSGQGNANGSITATATGGSGITYSLNSGPAQSSGTFNNLAAGSYTITAKTSAGCSGTGNFTVNNGNPCEGKNITVTATVTNSEKCSPTGSITINAAGGTGFTFKLNAGGTYQASNNFTNVAAGNYTVYAKDAGGCETTATTTVEALPNGALFTAVSNLIATKCAGCHTGSNPTSGISLGTDCDIVSKKTNIKTQAVDLGTMPKGGPALSATEKKTITDWITAGGNASN